MNNNTILTNEVRYKNALRKIYIFKFFAWFHMFSAILIPFFTGWAKLTVFQLTLLESWCMLCMLLFEIPTGAVADFIGRKYSLQAGLIIQALGFAIYVSMPNFYIYMLGEAIVALGFSLISGTEEAFIYDTLKSHNRESDSKKVFGRAESFGLAGIMTAAPLGSFIAHGLGLHYPMLLMFVPLSIAFVLLFFMKEPMPTADSTKERSKYIDILKNGVTIFYTHGILKILALDLVIITTMGFLMIWMYQLMLGRAGVPILYFGVVNTILVAFEIVLLNSYSRLEKLLRSKRRLIFLSAIIIGIMFIVGGLSRFIPVVIVVILSVGGFAMTRRTLMINYMNKYIPSERRATIISSVSMLVSLSKMIFFPIVGFIIDKVSLNAALISLGVITIIFAIFSKVREEHLID